VRRRRSKSVWTGPRVPSSVLLATKMVPSDTCADLLPLVLGVSEQWRWKAINTISLARWYARRGLCDKCGKDVAVAWFFWKSRRLTIDLSGPAQTEGKHWLTHDEIGNRKITRASPRRKSPQSA